MIFCVLGVPYLFFSAKDAFKKSWSIGFEGIIDFLLCGLFDKFLILDKTSLLETHGLGILQQRKTFAIFVQDQDLAIKGTKTSRLQ